MWVMWVVWAEVVIASSGAVGRTDAHLRLIHRNCLIKQRCARFGYARYESRLAVVGAGVAAARASRGVDVASLASALSSPSCGLD